MHLHPATKALTTTMHPVKNMRVHRPNTKFPKNLSGKVSHKTDNLAKLIIKVIIDFIFLTYLILRKCIFPSCFYGSAMCE